MSFTDPVEADPVQPEGQGEEGTTDAPYAEYLSRIPEQVRGDVEPVFRDWDANVTKRFQEASEYRKGWEPYEQAGVNNYDPEAVSWALQFFEAQQNNPQAVVEWAQNYAQERGLSFGAPAQPEVPQEQDFGLYGEQDQQLQQLIDQATGPLKQQLEQMQAHIETQQQQQQKAETEAFINGQMKQIEQAHPDLFSDPKSAEFHREKAYVYAGKYADSDPNNALQRGWEDWQKTIAHIEKQALQSKVDAPQPAEGGGVPDVNPPKIMRLDDPALRAEAEQFLRNQRG